MTTPSSSSFSDAAGGAPSAPAPDIEVPPSSPGAPVVERRLVRGGIYGLLLGLSLAIWAILLSMVAFGSWVIFALLVLLGIGIGVAWAQFAPPRQATPT